MTRPQYERSGDRENEARIKPKLEKAFKCELKPTGTYHPFDFIAVRDRKVIGFIEYKRRAGKFGAFDTVWLSYKKLQHLNAVSPIPVSFVVEWDDKIVWTRLFTAYWHSTIWAGRSDRDDSADMEPVAEIHKKDFRELREAP